MGVSAIENGADVDYAVGGAREGEP